MYFTYVTATRPEFTILKPKVSARFSGGREEKALPRVAGEEEAHFGGRLCFQSTGTHWEACLTGSKSPAAVTDGG